jgi:hypothetical protein
MILTKADFQLFGFKHVIEYKQPVTLMLGKAIVARTFKFNSISELRKENWFRDQLFCQTPILLYKIKNDFNQNGICFRMFWLGE